MQLNDAQIARFNRQGYLFFPSLLTDDEVTALQRAMPGYSQSPGAGGDT